MSPHRRGYAPPSEVCPLCRALFVIDPDQPPVAHLRATGEPVAICRQCVQLVSTMQQAHP